MEDHDESNSVVEMSTTKRRRAPARKPSSGATHRTRKPAARRRPATRRKAAAAPVSFESVIRSITGSVAVARAAIAEASENGASAVLRAADSASRASRRTVTRLADEWRAMEPRKKARLLAALLGAAAAASVPLVRKSLKK
jgi:hypothetical protein